MKRIFFLASLTLALLLPALSLAQDTAKPQAAPSKPRTVAALVSADAKSFLDPKQTRWTVANPALLAGHENQRVKVKYLLYSEDNRAQVLSVKPIPAYTANSASKTDAAFRR